MGLWQHDRVEIIANEQGNRTTPSYVAFTDTERLIGDAAKNQVRYASCSTEGHFMQAATHPSIFRSITQEYSLSHLFLSCSPG